MSVWHPPDVALPASLGAPASIGASVPLSVWHPPNVALPASLGAPASIDADFSYLYSINIGKIAAKLKVGFLSWLPSFPADLPPALPAPSPTSPPSRPSAILFNHGFLGSPLDMSHICESLALAGFVVVAPEMGESLTASYSESVDRATIVDATLALLPQHAWGTFGHSAGSFTCASHPATFELGRCLIAPGFQGYDGSDPLLLIASDADGCNKFFEAGGNSLRSKVAEDERSGRGATPIFGSAADLLAAPPSRRRALVFGADAKVDNPVVPLPCHISFLWARSNDRLVQLLSPLLPLAKLLGLFLLDFDVYKDNPNSDATAAEVVPVVSSFFAANAKAEDGST
ncbi:hypothetical protein TeGR_g15168 [Tetraparma gracilis]|uniref:1-alkyl-2-acetylglycerophosphocholine esterase n=1 Tax=Tetraparma gracilis TaxID=2962635 RepID=A0ABQ6MIW2_9STRA|nr:hypothetical protein TeGR_g15168 [Tetraparma gracilis]